MDVGITDTARVHLDQHLIGSGLRLGYVFDLPRNADSRYDCSLHSVFLPQLFDAGTYGLGA